MDLSGFMEIAIDEAKISLREGNHGFGAVIVNDDWLVAKAHDRDESDGDPTSHAEMNAIRLASKIAGKDLKGCVLLSTHEPCPMCAAAIVWSGIDHIGYGYSIDESLKQGRSRIDLTCDELFRRAGKSVTVEKNILHDRCGILYRGDVRGEIRRLRRCTPETLRSHNAESAHRRIEWFRENRDSFTFITDDLLESAYRLLLRRFGVDESDAPVIERSESRILFHSKNFCPTLEACGILGLDTRDVCRDYNERSVDLLVKRLDGRLGFTRNYDKLRPHAGYCEEMILLDNGEN